MCVIIVTQTLAGVQNVQREYVLKNVYQKYNGQISHKGGLFINGKLLD